MLKNKEVWFPAFAGMSGKQVLGMGRVAGDVGSSENLCIQFPLIPAKAGIGIGKNRARSPPSRG